MTNHVEGSVSDLGTMELQCLEYRASNFGIWGTEEEAVAAKLRKNRKNKENGIIGRTLTLDLGNGAEDCGEKLDSIAERAEEEEAAEKKVAIYVLFVLTLFLF